GNVPGKVVEGPGRAIGLHHDDGDGCLRRRGGMLAYPPRLSECNDPATVSGGGAMPRICRYRAATSRKDGARIVCCRVSYSVTRRSSSSGICSSAVNAKPASPTSSALLALST